MTKLYGIYWHQAFGGASIIEYYGSHEKALNTIERLGERNMHGTFEIKELYFNSSEYLPFVTGD